MNLRKSTIGGRAEEEGEGEEDYPPSRVPDDDMVLDPRTLGL